jgi:hypothetical protein
MKEGKNWRVPVDIEKRTCGCGQWQISENHALMQ